MTTMSTSGSTAQDSGLTRVRRRWRAGVVVATVVAALLAWLVANLIDASAVQVRMQDKVTTVNGVSVLIVSALAALAGWALLAVLERMSPSGRRIWTVIAAIVLLLSLTMPLSYGLGAASKWSLVAFHVVVGLVVIAGMSRSPAQR
jgi:uncharacterized paraquat-inducible protein A